MTPDRPSARRTRPIPPRDQFHADVAAYVAAGGDETVQRVITAVHGVGKRLDQWYSAQLVDLGLSAGEWAVISRLARNPDFAPMTPSRLAEAANIAASSMTHRLDRMVERGLVERLPDHDNRTRVLVSLTDAGRQTFRDAIQESNLVESDLLAGLTARQCAQLADLLEKVITGLDAADALPI